MTRIGIVGASGYTGGELGRILSRHPEAELTVVTSRQHQGKRLEEIFPHLRGRVELVCEIPDIDAICERADLFFTAVPHQSAMAIVPDLLDRGKKVIDLSADFRLRDVDVYERWYQQHTAPEYLSRAAYGLPELYRTEIAAADLVANPGCYPTCILLALAPLVKDGAVVAESIIADSKSGVSGAGRAANVATLYCEVADGFRPYKVGDHRHTPEIEQELALLAGRQVPVNFTPHLLPLSRGILSTIYASLQDGIDASTVEKIYADHYAEEPFIRLLGTKNYPATQYVKGSNFCDIGFSVDTRTGRVIVMAAIDNIGKGAAGQAVQNMNIMCGISEEAGLEDLPIYP